MKARSTVAALLALMLLSSATTAQATELSISQALRTALDNNPTLSAEREELVKAKATLLQARGNFLPSLTLTGEVSDNRYPTATGTYRTDSTTGSLALTQEIYAGGKYRAQHRQAKAQLSGAELTVLEAEEALAVEVYSSFYGVLLARETVAAARDAVETSQKHVLEVRQLLRLGLANRLELIRAEQQLSSNEASLASAHGTYDAQRIDLLNLMGLPPSSDYVPEGSLHAPTPEGAPESSVSRAKAQRPDIAIIEKEILAQKEQIRIAKSGMSPTVSITATADHDDPYHNDDRGEDSWSATLEVEIPIFDRNQTRGEVIKAQAQQEQNKKNLRQKELDILSEIELAWVEIADCQAQVDACAKALTLAKESLRLSQVGYREGVTPQLDLLQAQTDLTAARKDYSQALYNHLIKVVALKRAEGELIPWTLKGGDEP